MNDLPSTFRLLCFDPGLSTSGWSILLYSTSDQKIHVTNCGVLTPNDTVHLVANRAHRVRYGARLMTLHQLKQEVAELMDTYHPDFVVTENAFYKRNRLTAYCALVQWIVTVSVLLCQEYQKPLYKIAPRSAKQIISGSGDAKKLGVMQAIIEHEDVTFDPSIQVESLTEHTMDSIAIGYSFIKETLPAILNIWSSADVEDIEKIYGR